MNNMPRSPIALFCAAAILASGVHAAQPAAPGKGAASAAPASPAAVAAPELTTATYGDWLLRCQQAPGAGRQCEAVQTLAVDGRPIARIAVGRVASTGDFAVAVNLPANVAFAAPITLASATKSAPQLSLTWRRCQPAGCFGDVTPQAAAFAQWKGQSVAGVLAFLDGDGNQVSMPYSFRGLGDAIEALKQK